MALFDLMIDGTGGLVFLLAAAAAVLFFFFWSFLPRWGLLGLVRSSFPRSPIRLYH